MSHEAAVREALTRYLTESPTSGVLADRLARSARATLSLYDQAVGSPGSDTSWADHNLATIVASGLEDPSLETAAKALFLGTRRRLAAALEAEPDDLAPAAALALGTSAFPDDPRLASDVRLVAGAVALPHAGPHLIRAAVSMVVQASRSKDKGVQAATVEALTAVQSAADRVAAKLPNHPDVLLDRARLALHRSHQLEGEARHSAMDSAHALLADHEERFGATTEARALRGELLAWRARTGGPSDDIRRDAVALFEAQAAEGTLSPSQADRLVQAIARAKALSPETARHLASTIEALAGDNTSPWRKVMTTLLARTGEDSSLMRLWEGALLENSADEDAAAGLAERLLQNLRAGISSPFGSDVLERVLTALPHRSLAKLRPDDLGRILEHVGTTFGIARTASFMRDRVLANRELRKKEGTWKRALTLFSDLGDDDALLEVARLAATHTKFPRARLLIAERLLKGEPSLSELEEAAEALRPLLSLRGADGAAAHKLQQKVIGHPGFRQARIHALEAFEERIGVGKDTVFQLRVLHTTPSYVLVEAHQHKAPEVYEHRYLRTLIRGQDLPSGVHPMQLRKGDTFEGTLRGQAGDRGKESLRVYWIANPKQLKLTMGKEAVSARLDKEERSFAIGSGAAVPLKVFWDSKGKALVAKIVGKRDGKGGEFVERPSVTAEQLPEGMTTKSLGKGKRIWAPVERLDNDARDGRRTYRVVGEAVGQDPAQAKPAKTKEAKPTKKKGDSSAPPESTEAAETAKAVEVTDGSEPVPAPPAEAADGTEQEAAAPTEVQA